MLSTGSGHLALSSPVPVVLSRTFHLSCDLNRGQGPEVLAFQKIVVDVAVTGQAAQLPNSFVYISLSRLPALQSVPRLCLPGLKD